MLCYSFFDFIRGIIERRAESRSVMGNAVQFVILLFLFLHGLFLHGFEITQLPEINVSCFNTFF